VGRHFLAKSIPESQYAAFGTLMMVVACMPTMPLQMIFAQQSALALATGRERQLASMIRLAWLWTFIVWALGALVVLMFQKQSWPAGICRMRRVCGQCCRCCWCLCWYPCFRGCAGAAGFFLAGLVNHARQRGTFWNCGVSGAGAGFWRHGHDGGRGDRGRAFSDDCHLAVADLWSLPSEQFDRQSLMKQVVPLTFWIWRVSVHVHFGHDVCDGVLHRR